MGEDAGRLTQAAATHRQLQQESVLVINLSGDFMQFVFYAS